MAKLFYHTVHTVNAKDYTEGQLNVWADGQVDLEKWNISLQEHFRIIRHLDTGEVLYERYFNICKR